MSERNLIHHYKVLKQFLDISNDSSRSKSNSSRAARAREKLLKLSEAQFTELSTDVYDELKRRIDESRSEPDYLLPKSSFHPKRNQARQKLSSLPQSRFKDLVSDISYEIERRNLHVEPETQKEDYKSASHSEAEQTATNNDEQSEKHKDNAKIHIEQADNQNRNADEDEDEINNSRNINTSDIHNQIGVESMTVVPTKANLTWSSDEEDAPEQEHKNRLDLNQEQDSDNHLNQEQNSNCEDGNVELNRGIDENTATIQKSEKDLELSNLREQLRIIESENYMLQKKYDLLLEDYNYSVSQNKSLSNEIEDLHDERRTLLKRSETQNPKSMENVTELEKEVNTLKSSIAALRLENQSLKNSNTTSSKDLNSHRASAKTKSIDHSTVSRSSSETNLRNSVEKFVEKLEDFNNVKAHQQSSTTSIKKEASKWQSKYENLRANQINDEIYHKLMSTSEIKQYVAPDGLVSMKLVSSFQSLVETFLKTIDESPFDPDALIELIARISILVGEIATQSDISPLSNNYSTVLREAVLYSLTASRYYSSYSNLLPKYLVSRSIGEVCFALCDLISVSKLNTNDTYNESMSTPTKSENSSLDHIEKQDDFGVRPLKITQKLRDISYGSAANNGSSSLEPNPKRITSNNLFKQKVELDGNLNGNANRGIEQKNIEEYSAVRKAKITNNPNFNEDKNNLNTKISNENRSFENMDVSRNGFDTHEADYNRNPIPNSKVLPNADNDSREFNSSKKDEFNNEKLHNEFPESKNKNLIGNPFTNSNLVTEPENFNNVDKLVDNTKSIFNVKESNQHSERSFDNSRTKTPVTSPINKPLKNASAEKTKEISEKTNKESLKVNNSNLNINGVKNTTEKFFQKDGGLENIEPEKISKNVDLNNTFENSIISEQNSSFNDSSLIHRYDDSTEIDYDKQSSLPSSKSNVKSALLKLNSRDNISNNKIIPQKRGNIFDKIRKFENSDEKENHLKSPDRKSTKNTGSKSNSEDLDSSNKPVVNSSELDDEEVLITSTPNSETPNILEQDPSKPQSNKSSSSNSDSKNGFTNLMKKISLRRVKYEKNIGDKKKDDTVNPQLETQTTDEMSNVNLTKKAKDETSLGDLETDIKNTKSSLVFNANSLGKTNIIDPQIINEKEIDRLDKNLEEKTENDLKNMHVTEHLNVSKNIKADVGKFYDSDDSDNINGNVNKITNKISDKIKMSNNINLNENVNNGDDNYENIVNKDVVDKAKNLSPNVKELESNAKGIEAKSIDIESKSKDIESKAKDIQSKTKDIRVKPIDAESKTKDIESNTKDIESKSIDTDSKSKNTDSKSKDIDVKPIDIEPKSRDIESKAKNLSPSVKELESNAKGIEAKFIDIESKSKDIESKARDIQSKTKDIKVKPIDAESNTKDIESKSIDIDSKSKNTDSKAKDIESKTKDIEVKSKSIDSKSKNIEFESKDIDSKSKDIEPSAYEEISNSSFDNTSNRSTNDIQDKSGLINTTNKISFDKNQDEYSHNEVREYNNNGKSIGDEQDSTNYESDSEEDEARRRQEYRKSMAAASFNVDLFDIDDPDNTLTQVLLYLEHQTVQVISTIQSLLSAIKKPNATRGDLRDKSKAITIVISQMTEATNTSMNQTRNAQLKEHGSWVVKSLEDCYHRMDSLCKAKSDKKNSDFADKNFKQRLAGISFDIAKCTKELVKTVEEASLKEEIAHLDARISHADDLT